MSLTVERSFHVSTADHGRGVIEPAAGGKPFKPQPEPKPVGRIPRITRLMALAIKLDSYLRDGIVTDYAELARAGHVTRARITQIMDLNLLAPDIQAAILQLPLTVKGRDRIRERHLRGATAATSWIEQRKRWKQLVLKIAGEEHHGHPPVKR